MKNKFQNFVVLQYIKMRIIFPDLGLKLNNADDLYVSAVLGDVEGVKTCLNAGKFDVNKFYLFCDNSRREFFGETLLLRVLKFVKTKYDRFYEIAELLIKHPVLDINTWIDENNGTTCLSEMCDRACTFENTVALELLLSSERIAVNGGKFFCPLFNALRNIEREGDYF